MNARQLLLHLFWVFVATEIARGYVGDVDDYGS